MPGKGENHAKASHAGNVGESRASAPTTTNILCRSNATKRRRPSRFPQQWSESIFSSTELERLHLLLCARLFRPDHSDVPGFSRFIRETVRPCDLGTSVPRQGSAAFGIQYAQQD